MTAAVPLDLSAILAAPHDDAPRRALAAQLIAAGDPRGDFIERQLDASAERRAHGTTSRYWGMDASGDSMFRAEWSREVAPLVKEARFNRGFVESVTMDARAFLARGAELYRLAPIRSVRLTDAATVVQELAESGLFRQLVGLGLQVSGVGDDEAKALAGAADLANLRVLDLSFNAVTRAGLDAIAGSPHLAGLAFVNIGGNPCGDPVETFGVDEMTGLIAYAGCELPPLGRELEAKFGPLPWLHAPSRLLTYPPSFEDF